MFRRFRDRVNDAVFNAASSLSSNNDNSNNNNSSDARVSELAAMGFRESESRHALRVANGDMMQATEWLLINGSPLGTAGNPITETTATAMAVSTAQEDSEIQRAIQESLQTENNRSRNNNKKNNNNNSNSRQRKQQSAASRNSGRAAASRSENKYNVPKNKKKLSNTHPKVQMPKHLSQHDQEDIIMRCANRIAPYSLSVDTLLRSLKTIQSDPSNRKYYTVDTTTVMFQRSLNAPGVLDFLKAVNFRSNYNNRKALTLSQFDAAAFYLGVSALEQVQKNSSDYTKDKTLRLFQKDLVLALTSSAAGNVDADEELSTRRNFLSKLPSEPTKGGSQITVEYGVILNTSNSININTDNDNDKAPQSLTKITRGFDHDDTLGDVIHWLGGQASAIPRKLETGEWQLVDRNRQGTEEDYNFHRLDIEELRGRTLQYIGCWPSGRLAIVPKLSL
mmetsp:Transcript_12799/g.26949  ORF Transcript_12799/g.26949 Transcript_12799/m.26949 type:complete len:450 (+) Transcript_12799:207-1556(+)